MLFGADNSGQQFDRSMRNMEGGALVVSCANETTKALRRSSLSFLLQKGVFGVLFGGYKDLLRSNKAFAHNSRIQDTVNSQLLAELGGMRTTDDGFCVMAIGYNGYT